MRILFGVQATGNGHLSRALCLARHLARESGIQADYLVSGRAQGRLPKLEALGDFKWAHGLSFHTRGGQVSWRGTLQQNPWSRFWRDVRNLDLRSYDLVVTDFEPVTAWAARRQGVRCVGLGRQYTFWHSHAQLPVSLLQRMMIRQFAPCDIPLGMHWEPLQRNLLPPLIRPPGAQQPNSECILVYLPFEPINRVLQVLRNFPAYAFKVYHPDWPRQAPAGLGHIQGQRLCRQQFPLDFQQCCGVISNAGFTTSSEALAAGKKLLVKPLEGQFEQQANAQILHERGLGWSMPAFHSGYVEQWLQHGRPVQRHWPAVAPALVKWLSAGATEPVAALHHRLWSAAATQVA